MNGFGLGSLVTAVLYPIVGATFFLNFVTVLFNDVRIVKLGMVATIIVPTLSVGYVLRVVTYFIINSTMDVTIGGVITTGGDGWLAFGGKQFYLRSSMVFCVGFWGQ